MQSPTSQSLTPEKREGLIDLLVERYLDGMSVRDLALFFTDVQTEWLQGYSDGELAIVRAVVLIGNLDFKIFHQSFRNVARNCQHGNEG